MKERGKYQSTELTIELIARSITWSNEDSRVKIPLIGDDKSRNVRPGLPLRIHSLLVNNFAPYKNAEHTLSYNYNIITILYDPCI